MAVAFRRRVLTLLSLDFACLLIAFCLSAVLVSRWRSTNQLLHAYADAAADAESSSRRGPYGVYTVPNAYVSALITGSTTATFSGRTTIFSLDGTREVASTGFAYSTATYRKYSWTTVLDGQTTITGYRNIDSLLSSYTVKSSQYQASIDAARASAAGQASSSLTTAPASASAVSASGSASASAVTSAAPQRRNAAPTAALAKRQPAPAPTAAPQPVARRVQLEKRADSTDYHQGTSTVLLALIVVIMLLFLTRGLHVLYAIGKLADHKTPSSDAKATLRNLSRSILALMVVTMAVCIAFVAVSTIVFVGGNFGGVYGRGVDAAWFAFFVLSLVTGLFSVFGAYQHMPVEDEHSFAQPATLPTDEARFVLPPVGSQPNTAYTEQGLHSPFLPFSVPGVERASAPPTRRPASVASLEQLQRATHQYASPTHRRTSGDQPPPAYSPRPCKEDCPPGHSCP